MERRSSSRASSPTKDAQNAPEGAWMRGPPSESSTVTRGPAVFTPTTRPQRSTKGPPLLPGLMAAVCWMMRRLLCS